MRLFRLTLFILGALGSIFFNSPKAHAVAQLAAPAAAIGALELAALSATAATAAGVISVAQNEEIQKQIKVQIAEVKSLTGDALKQSVADSFLILFYMNNPRMICDQTLNILFNKKHNKAKAASQAQSNVKTRWLGCSQGPERNPNNCCQQFFEKFSDEIDEGRLSDRNASRPRNQLVVRNKIFGGVKCCLEFDRRHGGYEIFTKAGGKGFSHLGERSCGDLDENDPCKNSAHISEKHFGPDITGEHSPRSDLCKELLGVK